MAKSVKALITPEVLKWARESRIRLETNYVAKKLDVDVKQLEAWENGTEQPTIVELKKIAKLYKTHISVFYLPEPPIGFQSLIDYRVLPDTSAINEEQTYKLNANIIEAFERREMLIGFYELLDESPPQITLKTNEREEPTRAAKKITEFLELNRTQLQQAINPHAALKFWKQTVEAKGILVCHTSVNTHLSVELKTVRGFCIAQRPFPVIVLNSKDSPYGRIFTIIHELVHIALGKSIIQNTGFRGIGDSSLNQTERFCNQVAAEILVPENELLEIVKLQTLEKELSKISKSFHVSPEVIMRRLLTLDQISPQEYEMYRKTQQEKHKEKSNETGGIRPYHNRLLNTSGEYFARTAFTAYYEEKITISELASVFSNCDTKHLLEIESHIFV